ncbi:DUF5655 domain-containing protein [Actinophytocola oryzae]|uniref:DUF5655 domain-containing protein n=1 Tax=Actinophytocola oryzae TaxID=502181 RepID=A0A4R7VD19_9PSEU|nr:DUF5655 domain-containing protein [Actinophytocola oryzae]TDV46915.1 hypothetical protein CLV71_11098 [Actinophytocola oryzae]
MTWTCPHCARRFGRRNQSHECAPALTVEEYFSTGPAFERPIFEVVREHLESLGPVVVEPVQVGVFFKRSRMFAELRPRTRWVVLSFVVPGVVSSDRVTRRMAVSSNRTYHLTRLRSPSDVDEEVRSWLTEAYLSSPV